MDDQVVPGALSIESIKSMLLGMELVWLEAECSRYEFFADVVAQTHPDIGLVALDQDPEKALQLVARLNADSRDPGIRHAMGIPTAAANPTGYPVDIAKPIATASPTAAIRMAIVVAPVSDVQHSPLNVATPTATGWSCLRATADV